MKDCYYRNLLGQILQGDQEPLRRFIELRFEDGYEFEGQIFYGFESLRIHEAITFLKEDYEYIKSFIQ